jgi:hypothetical protein
LGKESVRDGGYVRLVVVVVGGGGSLDRGNSERGGGDALGVGGGGGGVERDALSFKKKLLIGYRLGQKYCTIVAFR